MSEPDLRTLLRQAPRGEALTRPLFAPLIFGLGAKVESVPVQSFVANPTQIANTLRRMQGFLRLDAMTAYYGSCLEAEALGCKLEWEAYPPEIVARPSSDSNQLTVAGVENRGRIPVAVDVVRRLRVMMGEGLPLLVGITGPYRLARQLAPDADDARLAGLIDLTGRVFLQLAQQLSEAGADILIAEEEPPAAGSPLHAAWRGHLSSAGKVVQFYKGLPVLLLPARLAPDELDQALAVGEDLLICPSIDSLSPDGLARLSRLRSYGLALPVDWLANPRAIADELAQRSLKPFRSGQPLLLTTAGEIPTSYDARRLPGIIGNIRSAMR